MKLFRSHFGVFLLLMLLQGCSLQQHQLNNLARELDQGDAAGVLVTVESMDYPERDYAQYQLTLGLLKAVNGDFQGAIVDLQNAKRVIEQLQATSVSENLGAVTVNETLRSYTSSASERMLLQQLLILSYLMQNDLEGARVEVLQAQEIEKSLPDEGLSGLVASSNYLGGLVYELNGEQDNAMISYRRAYQIMQSSEIPVPEALRDNLLELSYRLGLKNEYASYQQAFGRDFIAQERDQAQLVVLYWGGVVSAKKQWFMTVYEPSLGHNISLALPYYDKAYPQQTPLSFTVIGQQLRTEELDNVELLARADLDAQSAEIYAAALARMIVKQTMVHELEKQQDGEIAAMVLGITNMVTEVADVRSWNMLPATIQISRLTLPEGEYYLQQPDKARQLSLLSRDEYIARSATQLKADVTATLISADPPAELADLAAEASKANKAKEVSEVIEIQKTQETTEINEAEKADQVENTVKKEKTVTAESPGVATESGAAVTLDRIHLRAGKTVLLFYPGVAGKAYSYVEE